MGTEGNVVGHSLILEQVLLIKGMPQADTCCSTRLKIMVVPSLNLFFCTRGDMREGHAGKTGMPARSSHMAGEPQAALQIAVRGV